ncbi:hypothetical protein CEUSTIGMA_g1603.t1 [Chlamydomonas eustigma]|uniref:PUB domain-containing protein n=1 Tax=Chlamydomonas eustigma TaxID=1157962 RepID=A0A250WTJ8_9CHLO|nr:hypothetical protein CEUSTIGMA_g1603.t1 [Chlamydomonas eustigma]|eukprot:GAX74154.1 hypothetical protein CEUSTIGMA_g1603.t1 [Chlamydomonas eustigma]
MGYYGMPSAKLPPGPRSPLDDALYKIKNMESLEIMSKLIYNATVSPKEDKFRRIRLSNAKINALLVQVPGCVEALLEMGWETDTTDSDSLIIPTGRFMSMAEVRKVEDSKERLRKELNEVAKERLRKETRSASSSVTPVDTAGSSVRVQA